MNGRTDGRINGQAENTQPPPASLSWWRHKNTCRQAMNYRQRSNKIQLPTSARDNFDGSQEGCSMLQVHHLTTQFVFYHIDQRQFRYHTLSVTDKRWQFSRIKMTGILFSSPSSPCWWWGFNKSFPAGPFPCPVFTKPYSDTVCTLLWLSSLHSTSCDMTVQCTTLLFLLCVQTMSVVSVKFCPLQHVLSTAAIILLKF